MQGQIEESLRLMAWCRAKGELRSIGCASRGRAGKDGKLDELIDQFIRRVENAELLERGKL